MNTSLFSRNYYVIPYRISPTKLKKFKIVFWGSGGATSSHEEDYDDEDEEEMDEMNVEPKDEDNVSFTIVPHNNETGDEQSGGEDQEQSEEEDYVIPYNKG